MILAMLVICLLQEFLLVDSEVPLAEGISDSRKG